MSSFVRYLLGAVLLCSSSLSFSQQTGFLKGTVVLAESEEGAIGAIVTAYRVDQQAGRTVTDVSGNYTMELEEGTYRVTCQVAGMITDTAVADITTDQVTKLDFELSENVEVLDQVVVSAGKFDQKLEDLTVSMEIIKPDLIENKNATSIESALNQAPGLTIMDNEPQIRGGSGFTFGVGSRVAIVVDGMPLITGDAGRPEWSFVPVENIEQIEVIKGAASVLYGSAALSGVINIRTKYPRIKPITKFNFTSGVYSAPAQANKWWTQAPVYTGLNFLHSRIVKKNLDVVIGGNLFYDHGYIGPPGIDDPIIIDSLTDFTENDLKQYRARLNFNLRYRFPNIKGLSVGLNGNGMIARTNFALAWLDDSTNIYRAYPGAISLQEQKIFNLDPYITYHSKGGVQHSLRTRIFATDNVITNNQSNSSILLFGEYQMQRKFVQFDELNFTGGVSGTRTSSTAQLYAGNGRPNNFITNISGYAQLDKKLWEVLNVSAGVRFEYFKMNEQESVVKPVVRAGASLKVTEGTIVRASYGQGYRFPTIAERFILTSLGTFGVFPNPDLQPETSANTELGIKQGYKIGDDLIYGYFDLAGFVQNYENTIEYLFGIWDQTVAPYGFKFLNTGSTRVRGVDISWVASTNPKASWQLTLLAGYTYVLPVSLQPDYVYGFDNAPAGPNALSYNSTSIDTTDYLLKYRYKHSGKIDVQLSHKGFSVGYSMRFFSKMQNIDSAFVLLEDLTAAVPIFPNFYGVDYWQNSQSGIFIHDFRASYTFNLKESELRVAVVIDNLLNKEYALRPAKIEAPRKSAIQIVYKF